MMETSKGKLELEDYGNYYSAEVSCWNCNDRQHVYIVKGTPAVEVIKSCSKCGCLMNMKTGFRSERECSD